MLIVDEAWAKANPNSLASAGYGGVIGYVSQDTSGKNITRTDIDDYHALGLDVGLIYEYDPDSALGGTTQAYADASIAVHGAIALGAPTGMCLYAAIDFDAQPAQYGAVLAYARSFCAACHSFGYRAGMYGGYNTVTMLEGHGFPGLLWQTYAWSNGLWATGVAIRQVSNNIHIGRATVDKDTTMAADWGQWSAGPAHHPALNGDNLVDHWTNVQRGSTGQAVKVAQGLLLAHGLSVGSRSGQPDGVFGPTTDASTRTIQQQYHITVDGIFGPHTASVALYGIDVA